MFVVILLGMYKLLRVGHKWSIRPPARVNLFGWPRTFLMKSSPRNKWIHRSQCASIPRYPSQTATKNAAYEMALGPKLCSSTL